MDLRQYLTDCGITIPAFAERIGVAVQTVHRYVAGERFPTPDNLTLIQEATEGTVTANDFAELHRKRREADGRQDA